MCAVVASCSYPARKLPSQSDNYGQGEFGLVSIFINPSRRGSVRVRTPPRGAVMVRSTG